MFLQATLERLENVFQIQSQDEFVNMTNQTNGTVNGHGKFYKFHNQCNSTQLCELGPRTVKIQ